MIGHGRTTQVSLQEPSLAYVYTRAYAYTRLMFLMIILRGSLDLKLSQARFEINLMLVMVV